MSILVMVQARAP